MPVLVMFQGKREGTKLRINKAAYLIFLVNLWASLILCLEAHDLHTNRVEKNSNKELLRLILKLIVYFR